MGQLNKEERKKFETGKEVLKRFPLYIDDTPALPEREFVQKARQEVEKHNVKLIIIDYFQLMQCDRKFDDRRKEYYMIVKRIRELAEEMNITFIVCTMLPRSAASYGRKEPDLSDLRELGVAEKFIDVISFIHRPECYVLVKNESKEQGKHELAQILVRKNTLGKTGSFLLRFDGDASRFYEPIRKPCDG